MPELLALVVGTGIVDVSRRTLGLGAAQLITGTRALRRLPFPFASLPAARRSTVRSTSSTPIRATASPGSTAIAASSPWGGGDGRALNDAAELLRRDQPHVRRPHRVREHGRAPLARCRSPVPTTSSCPRSSSGGTRGPHVADDRRQRRIADCRRAHGHDSPADGLPRRRREHRAQWRTMVEQSLTDIGHGTLEKVVLARAVRVDADVPFDIPLVLGTSAVRSRGASSTPTAVSSAQARNCWSARPVPPATVRPLAGTSVDTARSLRSPKDAHEHQLVVDAVVTTLRRLCSDVSAEGPAALELPDVESPRRPRSPPRADATTTSVAQLARRAADPTPAVPAAHADGARRDHGARAAGLAPGPLRGAVRLDRRQRRRRVRHRFTRRRIAERRGDPRGRRHRDRLRSRRGMGRDAEKLTPMLQALVRP